MSYPFELPELGYSYDALEPHIDARTMEIHHSKHHAGYTKKLNAALEEHEGLHSWSVEELLASLDDIPEGIRTAVRNNGGGFANHRLFWQVLKPGGASEPHGALADAINDEFGSFGAFRASFTSAATGQFGSGWGWLKVSTDGRLRVYSTPNQDTPLMAGFTPILGCDVWEHAYYLKYQNERPKYVEAFWSAVNWDVVGELYAAAR